MLLVRDQLALWINDKMLLTSVRDIELIRALAEHRHFGRAAASLGLSQPAVSRSLALLEAEIGEQLIERSTMRPTDFGNVVLKIGEQVLSGFAEIDREIALRKGLEIGEFKVAMGPYAAAISGHEAAARLACAYPRLAIELQVMPWGGATEAVAGGKVDLALADIAEVDEYVDLDVRPVRSQQLSFICRAGHPLAERRPPEINEILNYPWVGVSVPRRNGLDLPSQDKAYGIYDQVHQRVRPRILVDNFLAMKGVAMKCDAIFGALPFQVKEEVAAGKLVVLREAPFISLNYGIIVKKHRTRSLAARAFIQLVEEVELSHSRTDE